MHMQVHALLRCAQTYEWLIMYMALTCVVAVVDACLTGLEA